MRRLALATAALSLGMTITACSTGSRATAHVGTVRLTVDRVVVQSSWEHAGAAPWHQSEITVVRPSTPWEPARATEWQFVQILAASDNADAMVAVHDAYADGQSHERYLSTVTMRKVRARSRYYSFPFAVPKGERLTQIHLGDVALDLTAVPWTSWPPPEGGR